MTVHSNTRPPAARSAAALGLLRGAATGRFVLQQCADCSSVQYPPRDACHACLGAELPWREVDPRGTLCAATTIRVSNEPYFQERLPWTIGIIAALAGPSIIAHLLPQCVVGDPVVLGLRLDASGRAVVVARPADVEPTPVSAIGNGAIQADSSMESSGVLETSPADSDFFDNPAGRRVLVTDGCSDLGQYVVAALLERSAAYVTVGCRTGDTTCGKHQDEEHLGWLAVRGSSHWPSPEWYLEAGLPSPDGATDTAEFDAVFDTATA